MNNPEKVTQLQCQALDEQFESIIGSGVSSALKYLPRIASLLRAQLDLLVNLLYYRLTIWDDRPEPGNALQNLTYYAMGFEKLQRKHKVGMLVLDVILPYIAKKLGNVQSLKQILTFFEAIAKILQTVNFILFVKDGKYRSLTQRILKIQMKFMNPTKIRILDFSLMNRQLLWGIYEGFLSTVLPFLKSFLNKSIRKLFYLAAYMDVSSQAQTCMVCGEEEIVLPQANNGCQHLACYYCMKVMMEGKEMANCSICGKQINEWRTFQH